LSQSTRLTDEWIDGQTDRISSLDRVYIPCSAVKINNEADDTVRFDSIYRCL